MGHGPDPDHARQDEIGGNVVPLPIYWPPHLSPERARQWLADLEELAAEREAEEQSIPRAAGNGRARRRAHLRLVTPSVTPTRQ